MTHLSLFSGIGGLDIAAEMAGIQTVGQCEWADYPTKILEKHWPDVPRWRDIRTLTKESFYERTGLRTVDVISGGFPCQPFSLSGKRRGTDDDRYLWPEMLRVIRELRPTWVLGENVPGIVNMALDEVLTDLENEDYSTQAFIIPACGVDAPHKRERVAILAYTEHRGGAVCGTGKLQDVAADAGEWADHGRRTERTVKRDSRTDEPRTAGVADGISEGIHGASSDTESLRLQGSCDRQICRWGELQASTYGTGGSHSAWERWPDEPGICRVADGVRNRVDRIKCLGNAVVPQQFYIFFKLMVDIEEGR